MENKNKEGYPDPTATEAIQAADKQPEKNIMVHKNNKGFG